jgi:hypothetical protein
MLKPRESTHSPLVPVTIEMQQEFGGLLRVDVRWDAAEESVRFRSGDRRDFTLKPGQHDLHVATSLLPFVTSGSVPITATPGAPLHITVDASPHFSGAHLNVRVQQGGRVIWHQGFQP